MGQNTSKVISDYYTCFNEKNWEGFFALLDDNVVHEINHGSAEIGKTVFRSFMERMNRCYDEQLSNVVVMVHPNGERAAVEYVVTGTYLKTDEGLPAAKGQTYKLAGGAFFEIRGSKITRVTNYYNLTKWLDQIKGS